MKALTNCNTREYAHEPCEGESHRAFESLIIKDCKELFFPSKMFVDIELSNFLLRKFKRFEAMDDNKIPTLTMGSRHRSFEELRWHCVSCKKSQSKTADKCSDCGEHFEDYMVWDRPEVDVDLILQKQVKSRSLKKHYDRNLC